MERPRLEHGMAQRDSLPGRGTWFSYPYTVFCSLYSNLVQPSLLAPPGRVCSATFSLDIAAQRPGLHHREASNAGLATTGTGCPFAWGELKGLWMLPLPWPGEWILEVSHWVQCRHYALSTHTYYSSQEEKVSQPWDVLGPCSSFKAIALEIGSAACRLTNSLTPDIIGPLSQYQGSCPGDWVLSIVSQQRDFRDRHSLAIAGCANKFVLFSVIDTHLF